MRKVILLTGLVLITSLSSLYLLSCGSSSGSGAVSSSGVSSSGNVAFYVTDSPDEDYKQVTVVIKSVQLQHTGRGDVCDILTTPETVDITDLSSTIRLLDIKECRATNYNRIRLEFNKETVLTNLGDITDSCTFTSYKDELNNPNVLDCTGDTCFINVNGAVTVLAKQNNELALDFDLKEFVVNNFNIPLSCTVSMKVAPLSASDIDAKHNEGYHKGISGYMSALDTLAKSFVLTAASGTFAVTYASVSEPGTDDLLSRAAADQLKVEVRSSAIDLDTLAINADSLSVKVEGTVSGLNAIAKTFTLTYQTNKTLTVDYQSAGVEGILSDGSIVEVQLKGHNGSSYVASEVEVELQ